VEHYVTNKIFWTAQRCKVTRSNRETRAKTRKNLNVY